VTFRGLARPTWDALDFTYFAGYALWNYLTTPFLLIYKDVDVGALDPLDGLSRLRVTFPDEIPRTRAGRFSISTTAEGCGGSITPSTL